MVKKGRRLYKQTLYTHKLFMVHVFARSHALQIRTCRRGFSKIRKIIGEKMTKKVSCCLILQRTTSEK